MIYSMEELLPVVAWLSEKYTSKESSSIPFEKANQLMQAVIYCIKEGEQTAGRKNELLSKGTKRTALEAYKYGYECVVERTKKANRRYNEMMQDFDSYGNRALKDTAEEGLSGFFLHYNARFEPQNHILTWDYPTLLSIESPFCGIDAIDAYIGYLSLEQVFLHRLPKEKVYEILQAYHPEQKELFINLLEVVLCSILRSQLTEEELLLASKEEIRNRYETMTEALINNYYDGNQELLQYCRICLPEEAARLVLSRE